jgi:hypothetical protein
MLCVTSPTFHSLNYMCHLIDVSLTSPARCHIFTQLMLAPPLYVVLR